MVQKIELKVKKLEHFDSELPLPSYETAGAAGADLRASMPNKETLVIPAGKRVLVPTGLSYEIPEGYEVQVRPRSGMSLKTNLLIVNSPGTIDCDYRGEIKIIIGNFGDDEAHIEHGDRIAQMVIAPVTQATIVETTSLSETERGQGGFGSTGKK
ncbi:deoxyuridine 5'-triphosphate nucleotidohydrolase [Halobacteriovorax marinus]|uniref:Deoxyuridine 5'-triphosphate nucleotidohydrolase n=1 Tax=Halobacteriovorax marinus (strain ATCC BAA-682 / DSM 15412 / SJ) TaxID=862908 RepID=E1X0D8_HALMS|nr:dUTP diphosphatase [Halobacteriovorax marinus]ATH07722.1 deoxyuridine 5'-triphosphate nucleotidohydrolase [Halobacteriovorax marinus]CBW26366.1 putative deoxyuridine 5'triphosphate nucleotidohydrolase [Halobacteriovorax marinus SJ]